MFFSGLGLAGRECWRPARGTGALARRPRARPSTRCGILALGASRAQHRGGKSAPVGPGGSRRSCATLLRSRRAKPDSAAEI